MDPVTLLGIISVIIRVGPPMLTQVIDLVNLTITWIKEGRGANDQEAALIMGAFYQAVNHIAARG